MRKEVCREQFFFVPLPPLRLAPAAPSVLGSARRPLLCWSKRFTCSPTNIPVFFFPFFPLRRPPSLFPPFLCPLVVPLLYLFPFTGEEDDARPGNDVSLTAAKTTRSVGVMVGTACLLSPPAGRKRYFNN